MKVVASVSRSILLQRSLTCHPPHISLLPQLQSQVVWYPAMVTPSPICAMYHFTLRASDIMCAATRATCTNDIIGTITQIRHASRAAANWGYGCKYYTLSTSVIS